MRILILLITFIITCASGVAQTARIDSIRHLLYQERQSPGERLQHLLAICGQYGSLPADSLFAYTAAADRIASRPGNRNYLPQVRYYTILTRSKKGLIDSAMALAQENILNDTVQQYRGLHWKIRLSVSGLLVRQNRLKEAMEKALALLGDAEKNQVPEEQVKAMIQVGWIYMELNQYADALQWFFKAAAVNDNLRKLPEPAVLHSNIAAVYNALHKNDSASYFINRAITRATEEQELTFLCNAYHIYADICLDSGNTRKAEDQLRKGLDIRRKIGDPFYVVSDLAQLGKFYASTGQYEKSLAVIREGISVAQSNKIDSKLLFLYNTLAQLYKSSGKLEAYSQTLETLINLKDTLYSRNSAEAISALQTKYALQQKENTIIQQRFDLAKKTYWMYGALLLLLSGALLSYSYYRTNRKKQQQKLELALLEEKRLAENAVLLAREEERKRIAADLHDNLGAFAAAIAANVDRMEAGAGAEVYDELKNNAQAIVSQLNDSIWVLTRETLALTAISDRLKVFIQRLQKSYPQVRIDVDEQLKTDVQLPPIQALHLFKILQEGIINALRHSGCSRIIIRLESNRGWEIRIADNGAGFDTGTTAAPPGNGLNNMMNRSREAGWDIQWESPETGGTTVRIRCTTN